MTLKKTALGIILSSMISFPLIAQNRSISFETNSLDEIKAKAKKENKLIFIDAYTTWCGPCKWMAKNSFTNDTTADYFNSNFINAKIDMEKGEGVEISKKYEVRCFPNLLFINGDGEIIHRSGGALDAAGLIKLAKVAQGNENNYKYYATNYKSKKNDSEFLLNYLSYMSTTCLSSDNALADYFSNQPETELVSRSNWEIIKKHTNSTTGKEFNYLIKNHQLYYERYTKDSVDEKILDVIVNQGRKIIYSKTFNSEKFTAYMKEISGLSLPNYEAILFNINMEYFALTEDWSNFGKLILKDTDKFLKEENYNHVSWTIYEKISDVTVVEKASKLMDSYVKKYAGKPIFAEYDTYASLLFKLKKKNEALNAANETIKIAKQMGMPESEYQGTLELITKINAL